MSTSEPSDAGTDVLVAPPLFGYLRRLRAATRQLPPDERRRLREQVEAHLREAIPPGARRADVEEVLRRLGTPEEVVATALADGVAGPVRTRVGLLRRLRWLRRGTVIVLVVVLAAFGAGLGWGVDYATSPSLVAEGYGGWLPGSGRGLVAPYWVFPQPNAEVAAFGRTQGVYVLVHNPSGWSQTVTGFSPDQFGVEFSSLRIRLAPVDVRYLALPEADRFRRLPFTIPSGGYAILRAYWTTVDCSGPRSSTYIANVVLRVRVGGLLERTEDLPFQGVTFALVTLPSAPEHPRCPDLADYSSTTNG